MTEVYLTVFPHTDVYKDHEKEPNKPLTPMQEVNAALKECGFGIFHIRLLLTTLVGFVAGVLVSNTTSYLLPTAECDLDMNLVQKGLLNAMPYIGMLCSTLIAGFLTDTFGRKIFIYAGYCGICVFTILSASSQSYSLLVSAKFFEGVLFGTSFSAAVTILSEFCYNEIRDRVLVCRSSFASVSQILIASMSWGILINDWHFSFFDGKFVLNAWNIYLYAMSLWSLTALILYTFIPESPKYLVTQKRYDEARAILINMYKENTRKPEGEFLYKDLWKKEAIMADENKTKVTFSHHLVIGLHNIKPMFQMPLLKYLLLICSLNLCVMCTYNVLRLWYPQVSTIIEHNSFTTSQGSNQDLCGLLDVYTGEQRLREINVTTSDVCTPKKSGAETYLNSIIIGCVCLVPLFITGVIVTKIGKKPLIILTTLTALASILGLRFAGSDTAVTILFAVSIALFQMLMCLNQAVVIEFFPTTTRSLAISIMMFVGRIGTLAGNIAFPILLKIGCVFPFYTFAAMMLCCVMMSLFLPTRKK